MTKIVEKPDTPISKLANIGLYYIRAVDSLWQGIDHVLAAPRTRASIFLTDAFQWMIEHGKRILTAEVGGWYDCGALGTLLETNEILLRKGAARRRGFPRRDDPRSGVHRGRGRRSSAARSGPTSRWSAVPGSATARLRNAIVGRDAVLGGSRSTARCSGQQRGRSRASGQHDTGRSFRGDREGLIRPPRGPMASVDDLCRSYLDLKYHFDPAAASSAGLVSHDARLGRLRSPRRCTRTWRRCARSPARSRSWSPTTSSGDRPHRAARRDPERDLPAGARAPHVRESGLLAGARCSRAFTPIISRRNGAAGGRAPAALERLKAMPRLPRRRPGHA